MRFPKGTGSDCYDRTEDAKAVTVLEEHIFTVVVHLIIGHQMKWGTITALAIAILNCKSKHILSGPFVFRGFKANAGVSARASLFVAKLGQPNHHGHEYDLPKFPKHRYVWRL